MPASTDRRWTREETMLAFELYCTIPSGKVTVYNERIIALANAIDRTAGSIKLKLQNFKAYDRSYTQDGKTGLTHGSKLDEAVCKEFLVDWDALVLETNEIKVRLGLVDAQIIEETDVSDQVQEIPIGFDANRVRMERVGQSFFRRALLSAYNSKCCFTGIAIPELLRASHIKPWSDANDMNEKTNPRNGLLLNALHDAAFDKFFITITTDFTILVSSQLSLDSDVNKKFFASLHGKKNDVA